MAKSKKKKSVLEMLMGYSPPKRRSGSIANFARVCRTNSATAPKKRKTYNSLADVFGVSKPKRKKKGLFG